MLFQKNPRDRAVLRKRTTLAVYPMSTPSSVRPGVQIGQSQAVRFEGPYEALSLFALSRTSRAFKSERVRAAPQGLFQDKAYVRLCPKRSQRAACFWDRFRLSFCGAQTDSQDSVWKSIAFLFVSSKVGQVEYGSPASQPFPKYKSTC